MPMPRWVANFNKRVFNPIQLRREGGWPILTHRGRNSGTQHRTPIDAIELDDGFMFFVVYGPSSDWVQNVLADGQASLRVDGVEVELTSPTLIDAEEARRLAPPDTKFPPSWARVSDFLLMDKKISDEAGTAVSGPARSNP